MKRSSAVGLSIVPLLAACSQPRQIALDPCNPQYYVAASCANAVQSQGYFYLGNWYPHSYPYPITFYQRGYDGFIASGGRVTVVPTSAFSPVAARSGTVRGGFGSAGEAHASAGE
jgi:hypothetical protein